MPARFYDNLSEICREVVASFQFYDSFERKKLNLAYDRYESSLLKKNAFYHPPRIDFDCLLDV